MKVGILAGGYGSRLAEETEIRPKPMVEIGGMPILWHIMMTTRHFGYDDFAIALGYKGEYIKHWFRDYSALGGTMKVNTGSGSVHRYRQDLARVERRSDRHRPQHHDGWPHQAPGPWMGNDTFMLTWGDGVADVDLDELLAFHRSHGKLATMTAVRPPARFGHIEFDGDRVVEFSEKPQTGEGWINGAFFILEPGVSTTSPATTSCSSTSRCDGWLPTDNSWPTATNLLAVHGYAAREANPAEHVGGRQGTLEDLGLVE